MKLMKYVLVTLLVRSGETESYTRHVLHQPEGVTEKEAMAMAFANEERCGYEWEDEDKDSAYDCGGELYIALDRVERLTKAEYKVLHKYV